MPPRTNPFQQLVATIEQLLNSVPGATVQQSVMVAAKSGGETEVDILVTVPTGGRELRIVIECRDRSRKASVEWMREIIGKRFDVPSISHWVAVSSKGFSHKAERLAMQGGIEIKKLETVGDYIWERLPFQIAGPRGVEVSSFDCMVIFEESVNGLEVFPPETIIVDQHGISHPARSIEEYAKSLCLDEAFRRAREGSSGDELHLTVNLEGSKFVLPSGVALKPLVAVATLQWTQASVAVTSQTQLYGDQPIQIAELEAGELGVVARFTGTFTEEGKLEVIQEYGAKGEMTVQHRLQFKDSTKATPPQ